ncbi:RagB/SusD family nutrient uptake outer membrane protein [Muricauda sp. 2012CJ35-5]|uniref:RagB/SusD family nutrient uptake outer membrane protein n=1 Tax=Flagellimonas spongiicola TaxID=2942208 RepID=A0ABT0PR80_9FLAO|nr:RagB/SusD family nutrient uptake outer membrane protein [Allomuricauda spongiicola]MCL6273903.1 RagB/SusD family nutrient uptake outer membrane protein [Allomuricauda spongiicola]
MKRNQIRFYLLTLLSVGTIASCTDLEIEETDSIISAGFQGLDDPASGVTGLYSSIAGQYADQANKFALDEVTTDAFLVPTRGTDWGDNGRWRNLHTHEWNAEAVDIVTPFQQWNGNQLVASQILDSRSNPSGQDVADASFLRAYSMYIILDLFGQVPVRDTQLPSSSIPEVLTGADAVNFILADLDAAISGLPTVAAGSGDANQTGSKAAARYLRAKVLLNRHIFENQLTGGGGTPNAGDMAEVISLIDAIEADGYALEAGYFDLFRDSPDNETIWWLAAGTGNRIYNGLHYNSTSNGGGGWNGFSTLAEYYDMFEGDANNNRLDASGAAIDGQEERRGGVPPMGTVFSGADQTEESDDGFELGSNVGFGFLVGQQYDLDGTPLNDRPGNPLEFSRDFVDNSGANSLINNSERTGIRVQKYGARYNGGFTNHEIIFRFSDAHLMRAEAMMRSGGDPTSEVNELRVLRGATPLASVGEAELLAERGRELYAETWRRNDMIRFGQYTRQWEFKAANSVGNDKYKLFPIPNPQLLANPNLVQNPDY